MKPGTHAVGAKGKRRTQSFALSGLALRMTADTPDRPILVERLDHDIAFAHSYVGQ